MDAVSTYMAGCETSFSNDTNKQIIAADVLGLRHSKQRSVQLLLHGDVTCTKTLVYIYIFS